jgi:hypothetical protein
MRLLAARSNERPPTEEALRAYYARHRAEYAPPARVSLWHVFLASATHGEATARDAQLRLARLRADRQAPAEAVRHGDSFSVPPHLIAQSPAQIAKLFGPAFAAAITPAEARTWIGPVPSAYGAHLVWIEAREPSTPPPFDDVRERVRERWQSEQRQARVAALLRDLARRYPLRVESAAWRPRSTS